MRAGPYLDVLPLNALLDAGDMHLLGGQLLAVAAEGRRGQHRHVRAAEVVNDQLVAWQ